MDAEKEIQLVNKFATMCTHGHVVLNPYTGQRVYVPCGVCDACLYSKSLQNVLYAKTQEKFSKYTYFITLTYNSKYVPYYTITKVSESDMLEKNSSVSAKSFSLYRINIKPRMPIYRSDKSKRATKHYSGVRKISRLCSGDSVLSQVKGLCMNDEHFEFVRLSDEYVREYCAQADLSMNGKYPQYAGRYGYLCRADLQLFMKRLRYSIFKQQGYYEKIHSYITGEYGPKTFRPHFHLLLFFESDWLSENIGQIISKCWPFGRVDWSKARQDASCYVAGYTNAFSRTPLHLRDSSKLRPFGRFSNGFARSVTEVFLGASKRGRKGFDVFLDGYGVDYNGRLLQLRPRRSCLDSCFFRYASNSRSSVSQLCKVVRQVCSILNRPGYRRLKLYGVAKRMLWYYFEKLSPSEYHYLIDNEKDSVYLDLCYFLKIDPYSLVTEEFKRSFFSRFYQLFRVTVQFLHAHDISVRDFKNTSGMLWHWIQNSKDFYDYRESRSLNDALAFIARYGDSRFSFLVTPSEQNFEAYRNTYIAGLSDARCELLVNNSVKHREINDLNIKFVQYGTL